MLLLNKVPVCYCGHFNFVSDLLFSWWHSMTQQMCSSQTSASQIHDAQDTKFIFRIVINIFVLAQNLKSDYVTEDFNLHS